VKAPGPVDQTKGDSFMSRVIQTVHPEQAVELHPHQDVIETVVDRVTRAIFAYRYPRETYTDPLFKAEREDCRLLAVQFQELFTAEPLTLANAAEKLTDFSCKLLFGDRLLKTNTRGQVLDFAESYIEDLNKLFGGADMRVAQGSRSWRYRPEDEPDDSELEDLGPKKAVN
jgi:hypothetical protein